MHPVGSELVPRQSDSFASPRTCSGCILRATSAVGGRIKAMSHHAAKAARLQPIAHLMFLLCLVSLGFVDRGAVAQELVGQAPRRMTMDLTLLTVEQERVRVA